MNAKRLAMILLLLSCLFAGFAEGDADWARRPVTGVVALKGDDSIRPMTVLEGLPVKGERGRLSYPLRGDLNLRDSGPGWERPRAQSANGSLSLATNALRVSEVCAEAIEVAPVWIQQSLEDAFARIGSHSDDYANLLLGVEDPRLIDEVAFQIAHVAPMELRRLAIQSDEQLLILNAEKLYAHDEFLHYVRLVEHGEQVPGGDFWTTIAYMVEDSGEQIEKELPMDYYYWYIVHPKINLEYVKMNDEPSANQSTYGYFWREFLFDDPSDENSYVRHYFESVPNEVAQSELEALAAYSVGHITSRSGDIFPVIYDENGGGVLLGEMREDAGEIIVTSIRLEQAYEDGVSSLLENVVLYGNSAQLLPKSEKVLVIKDRGSSVIESILDDEGYTYRVIAADRIGRFSLSDYGKIIVASDQPKELYETLVENKSWFTDWHGLSIPGFLQCGDLNEAEIGTLRFGGYPLLSDVMSNPEILWKGKARSTGGRRPFHDGESALIALGKWVNKVVPVLARDAVRRGVQANQIAVEHNGNCGENQDILGAAARTCLIPISSIDLHAEDHVWNEIYDGGWHFYETWRGGVQTTVGGVGTGVKDTDNGGHYRFSGTFRWRNDGVIEVITDRYSETCELEAIVRDANEVPVDGACVEVWTDYVHGDYARCAWGYTDESGVVRMKLGNSRSLYARVESPLGNYPAGVNDIEKFVSGSMADRTYTWEVSVPGIMPQLDLNLVSPPPVADGAARLVISYEAPYRTLYCENQIDRNVGAQKLSPGHIDFFVCDAENLENLESGETVNAFDVMRDSDGGTLEFDVDPEREYYMVFSNRESQNLNMALYYSVDVLTSEGEVQDSLSNWVKVPAGEDHIVKFAQASNSAPVIVEAGFLDTAITSVGGGTLRAVAYVTDANGLSDIDRVEVLYQGAPTGFLLVDDGTGGDGVAADSLFTLETSIWPGLPAGQHIVEIAATDSAGLESVHWPYVEVKEGLATPSHSLIHKDHGLIIKEARAKVSEALFANSAGLRLLNGASPIIMAGGFGYTALSTDAGGELTMLAHIDFAGQNTLSVESFLQGGALGMFLRDDGDDGDAAAGDGQFTFQTAITPGLVPGRYLIEIVAESTGGERSRTYPYLTVSE